VLQKCRQDAFDLLQLLVDVSLPLLLDRPARLFLLAGFQGIALLLLTQFGFLALSD